MDEQKTALLDLLSSLVDESCAFRRLLASVSLNLKETDNLRQAKENARFVINQMIELLTEEKDSLDSLGD